MTGPAGSFTFKQLQDAVIEAAVSTPFVLKATDLQPASDPAHPIADLFAAYLGGVSLTLELSAAPAFEGASATVKGVLQATALGLVKPGATAVFTVVGGFTQVLLTLATPADWSPQKSFPTLANSAFDDLIWSQAALLLDSSDGQALPDAFPEVFGYPAYPATIKPMAGLSLQAEVALPPSLAPGEGLVAVQWVFGTGPRSLSGPLAPLKGALAAPPSALLTVPLGAQTLGAFEGDFALVLGGVVDQTTSGDDLAPYSLVPIQLTATVTCKTPAKPIAFALRADLDTGRAAPIDLRLIPSDGGLDICQLAEVMGALLGAANPDVSWLDGIPGVQALTLEGGVIEISRLPDGPPVPLGLSFDVGLALPVDGWTVFSGVSLNAVAATFFYTPGQAGSLLVMAEATATIGGVAADVQFSLPDFHFNICLQAPSSGASGGESPAAADLSAVLGGMMSGVSLPGWATVKQGASFQLSGALKDQQAILTAELSDLWSWEDNGLKLALKDISVSLGYEGGAFAGGFTAALTVAGTALLVGVSHDTGWVVEGATMSPISLKARDLADQVMADLGLQLPDINPLPDLDLKNLAVRYSEVDGSFSLQALCDATFEVLGHSSGPIAFGLEIQRTAATTDGPVPPHSVLIQGYLWIGSNAFEIDFSQGDATLLAGKWVASEDSPGLDLRHILDALGLDLAFLPDSIDLALESADFLYDITAGLFVLQASSKMFGEFAFVHRAAATGAAPVPLIYGFAAVVSSSINLSDLPLVGEDLAKIATLSVSGLTVSIANEGFGIAGPVLNAPFSDPRYAPFLNASHPTLPASPSETASALISAALDYGAGSVPLRIPLHTAAPAASGRTTDAGEAGIGASAGGDATLWYSLQKSFGPVTFERIGLSYSSETLWVEIDARLQAGPMSLELLGLGAGSPLSTFSPRFCIHGIGVSYEQPPITIGGSLVNTAPLGSDAYAFFGTLVVEGPSFSLEAVGYYGDTDGYKSLFVFLSASMAIGGPPQFSVTGIAGGFGYNSEVRLPAIADLDTFPFLLALPTAPAPDPFKLGGPGATPLQALTSLTTAAPPWVAGSPGEIWVAAGLSFSSYELVNGSAMLLVEAGAELQIALFGVAGAQFPQKGANEVYAQVVLDIEARIQPQRGFFGVDAVLSPSSFLLDPACVLRGGFSFYVWYAPSNYEGDFVLTLGGYHPAFEPPPWYPQIPRLGFTWTMDGNVTVSGGAYLALTPSVMMAGGQLAVTFQSGNLKAWLNAHADIIIRWKPFWLDAEIGITVGISYKLDLLFTSVTLSVELGCDLEIWGPTTGGQVHVDWYIISFTIPFGADKNNGQALPDWSAIEAVLPNHAAQGDPRNPLSLQVTGGLISKGASKTPSAAAGLDRADASGPAPDDFWIVRGGSFAFTTQSAVPATTVTVAGPSEGLVDPTPATSFNVHPLGWSNVQAVHTVNFTDSAGEDLSNAFDIVVLTGSAPTSLWGAPPEAPGVGPQVPTGTAQTLPGQQVGVSMVLKSPTLGAFAGPVDQAYLKQEDLLLAGALLPINPADAAAGAVPTNSAVAIDAIVDPGKGLTGAGAVARDAIFKALVTAGYGAGSNDPLDGLVTDIGVNAALSDEPLLVVSI